jgi:RNA polymerase sigma factor (sigma-70 family)
MEKTDGELVVLTCSGQNEMFGCLTQRHRPRALRIALSVVGSEAVAQELVQEALLQAYLSLDRLRDPDRFGAWLRGILRNVCRSHHRQERLPPLLSWDDTAAEAELIAPAADDPAWVVERRERKRQVLEAVAALSAPNRLATTLFYFDQLSVQEVASELGISVAAVKGRLHESRRQLREQLSFWCPEGATVTTPRGRQKMLKVDVVPVSHHMDSPLDYEDPRTSEAHARRFLLRTLMSQGAGLTRDWVGLMEPARQRFLPIRVGWDASGIAGVLEGSSAEVAPAMSLMYRLLKETETRVESVRIAPLADGLLHGRIQMRQSQTPREVEARPGDAIALAVQTGSPIYVSPEMMKEGTWDLSDPISLVRRIRPAADGVSLAQAAAEPFVARVAEGMLEQGVLYLQGKRDNRVGEILVRLRWLDEMPDRRRSLIYVFHQAAGSSSGGNTALPQEMLPVLVAHFKERAGLDLAVTDREQEGHGTVRCLGKTYDLLVSTSPTAAGEELSLRLEEAPAAA